MFVLRTPKSKGNKYHARRTSVGSITFDSSREAKRWQELELLQRAGQITNLVRQVRIPLHVNGEKIGHIVPDFRYTENGVEIHEDVKSAATITPMFRWKARHLLAEHGIALRIIK